MSERPPAVNGDSKAAKSQKEMSKAERRELQEKQRAAKAAAKTGAQPTASTSKPQAKEQKPSSSTPSKAPKASHVETTPNRQTVSRAAAPAPASAVDEQDKLRGLRLFSHFGLPKHAGTLSKNVGREIHPAILQLALRFAEFKITGANARCLATLQALKSVIQDYQTPSDSTMNRDLIKHLTPQISYLVSARGMSVSMGNAIRQVKLHISNLSIDTPERDAKRELCEQIDTYIQEKIITADQVITASARSKITDGDVILTYARSSVVEKVLLEAHSMGDRFSVVIVDSRPMLEGKRLLAVLSAAGIACTYLLLSAIGSVMTEVTKVFVGAHSLHANGAVSSRAGTAIVAMMAKSYSIPVLVCCETYKYTPGVQLDSFSKNELAPSGDAFSSPSPTLPRLPLATHQQESANLHVLHPLYDLTPPTSITAVVTEVGIIPPNSLSWIPLQAE